MSRRLLSWTDRKFEFSNPIELYPNIQIRLRGTPARAADLLQNCSDQDRIRKPENKWSAQEHLGHLLDTEPLTVIQINDFIRCASELTMPRSSNQITGEANYNNQDLSEILARFRKARLDTVNMLEMFDLETVTHVIVHPRIGNEMQLADYLYLVAEHDDHHLASIWQLLLKYG